MIGLGVSCWSICLYVVAAAVSSLSFANIKAFGRHLGISRGLSRMSISQMFGFHGSTGVGLLQIFLQNFEIHHLQ